MCEIASKACEQAALYFAPDVVGGVLATSVLGGNRALREEEFPFGFRTCSRSVQLADNCV